MKVPLNPIQRRAWRNPRRWGNGLLRVAEVEAEGGHSRRVTQSDRLHPVYLSVAPLGARRLRR